MGKIHETPCNDNWLLVIVVDILHKYICSVCSIEHFAWQCWQLKPCLYYGIIFSTLHKLFVWANKFFLFDNDKLKNFVLDIILSVLFPFFKWLYCQSYILNKNFWVISSDNQEFQTYFGHSSNVQNNAESRFNIL